MVIEKIVDLRKCPTPLRLVKLPQPEPRAGEILIEVSVCGVCHTELDEIEGRTPPARLPLVPGHEVVGRVAQLGPGVRRHAVGDRVGVGWIHSSTGNPDENLSPAFQATGRDVDGGYAEFMTVPENYAYPIPEVFGDAEAAPLLCAGAVGFRALRLAGLRDGEPLGLTGFGGSAHLVLQVVRHQFPQSPVYVFARDAGERAFAQQLGAVWAGDTADRAPQPLAAIIDTTPAWKPVVEALANLRPGGRLVINAIRKENRDRDYLLQLNYHEHLWLERQIQSVANVTQYDIREFLRIAADIPLRPHVISYSLAQANLALAALHAGSVQGAKVLRIAGTGDKSTSGQPA
jgi:propanol-preferring alcohol dehydrogenase